MKFLLIHLGISIDWIRLIDSHQVLHDSYVEKRMPRPSQTPKALKNSRNATKRKAAGPEAPHADLAAVRDLFLPRPRRTVTLPLPRSLKTELARDGQDMGRYIEVAVISFTEDLATLWSAAYDFCRTRRHQAPDDAVENTSARISQEAFERVEALAETLRAHEVQGVTRARVLSGLIALRRLRDQADAAPRAKAKARRGTRG